MSGTLLGKKRMYMGVSDEPPTSLWSLLWTCKEECGYFEWLGGSSVATVLYGTLKTFIIAKKVLDVVCDRSIVISIEGNIGAGKSTLLNNLASRYPNKRVLKFVCEKTGWLWWWLLRPRDGTMKPVWAVNFQMYVMLTQIYEFVLGLRRPVVLVLMERSTVSSTLVFTRHALQTGVLTKQHVSFLVDLQDEVGCEPDLYVFLNTPADRSLENIRTRGREQEADLTLEHMIELEQLHHDMRRFLVQSGFCEEERVIATVDNMDVRVLEDIVKIAAGCT